MHACICTTTHLHMYVYIYSIIVVQTLIGEKAALLNYDDESDLSNVLHRQRRLVSVEREIIALTDKVCICVPCHCIC